ncbi:MAG: type II secretion system protein [bacterium]
MKYKTYTELNSKRAFTLVEVIVAIGLFAIVMLVAISVILSVIDNDRKAQAVNSVVNNLNFAIDSMVRDIKTGRAYKCNYTPFPFAESDAAGCGSDQNSLRLVSTISGKPRLVRYSFLPRDSNAPGRIEKTECVDTVCTSPGDPKTGIITSPEVDVTSMKFIVNPGTPGSVQPTVFLIIQGTGAVSPTDASNFTVQTLISQRRLNI